MPIMCSVQLPEGKDPEQIEKALADIASVLMKDFSAEPNQVRVMIDELPRNRYIAGGVMAFDMPDFNHKGD